ncbi:PAS domain S-box-containing protein [Bryocella elongata]|uniref:histidine kinase n=1 Tax=Bryocella elongata TaxID=863522 RepID=A0A1H6BEQ2_9BACT|nr:PAS domain-containing protein [Bryocella elongata]SEG59160.1 PAS domain S-box-containing protein [Bryocella elongata]
MATVSFRGLTSRSARFGAAAGIVALVFGLQFLLVRLVGPLPPYLLFYPAVMLAALFAGVWPGILATGLSAVAVDIWLLPPVGRLSIVNRADAVSMVCFGGMGLLMSVVAERYRRGQRKLAESAEARLQLFVEYAPAALAMFDREMRYVCASERWMSGVGLDVANPRGKSHYEVYPGLPEAWKEEHRRGLTGETIEREAERFDSPDGRVRWLHREIRPWIDTNGEVGGIIVFSEDVTERRRTQEQLERLGRTYAVLCDINQTIVREKDRGAMLSAACRIAVERGNFGMAWIGVIDLATGRISVLTSSGDDDGYLERVGVGKDDPRMLDCPATESVRTGERVVCNDIATDPRFRLWRDEGLTSGFGSMASFPLRLKDEVCGVFVLYAEEAGFFDTQELALLDEMAMDISYAMDLSQREDERLKVEEELRWRTTFFEALLESSPDAISVTDVDRRVIFQNQQFARVWNLPQEVARGESSLRREFVRLRAKDPERHIQRVEEIYAHPEMVTQDECELLNGTLLSRFTSPVTDPSGKYLGRIWVFQDITQQRQLERQLRQSQKMEAVGQLTGGIAHDFNNLLGIILGNLELLEVMLAGDEAAKQRLQTVRMASERGADVTRRLLSFSRSGELKPSPTKLDRSIANVVGLARTMGPDIEFAMQVDASIPPVLVDSSGLESALLNLIVNSRDAMPGGGVITIATRSTHLEGTHPLVRARELKEDTYACIQISDTGFGMSSETLEKVFEPFFTTKQPGHGTGLGLAMVYGFVKQSGGAVRIYSEENHGTTVTVYLPLMDGGTLRESPAVHSATAAQQCGNVLLVDDEPGLVELAEIYLEALGYTVFAAQTPAEALKIAAQEEKLDLLITDIIMPGGMNGVELAREIREQFPDIRVIYSSGYPANAMAGRGLPTLDGSFLRKPYQRSEFDRAVRMAMAVV